MIMRPPVVVTAPGKAFLMGEYAVFEGADAVVMAVARRVVLKPGCGRMRPLVARARQAAARALGRSEMASTSWEAVSTPLYRGRTKLGLGSSAAVAAATVATVFHESGEDIASPGVRRRIWDIAHSVHVEWSRFRGSGADIAASVFGGFLRFRREPDGSAQILSWAPPPGVRFVFVWTGQSASTPAMTRAIRRLRKVIPWTYRDLMAEMTGVSQQFVFDGMREARALFEAVARYQHLMTWLGHLAGVPIVTPFASATDAVARRFGGAAKPSGAGGGDLVVAALPEDVDLEAFWTAIGPCPHEFLDLRMDPDGVRVEEAPPDFKASSE